MSPTRYRYSHSCPSRKSRSAGPDSPGVPRCVSLTQIVAVSMYAPMVHPFPDHRAPLLPRTVARGWRLGAIVGTGCALAAVKKPVTARLLRDVEGEGGYRTINKHLYGGLRTTLGLDVDLVTIGRMTQVPGPPSRLSRGGTYSCGSGTGASWVRTRPSTSSSASSSGHYLGRGIAPSLSVAGAVVGGVRPRRSPLALRLDRVPRGLVRSSRKGEMRRGALMQDGTIDWAAVRRDRGYLSEKDLLSALWLNRPDDRASWSRPLRAWSGAVNVDVDSGQSGSSDRRGPGGRRASKDDTSRAGVMPITSGSGRSAPLLPWCSRPQGTPLEVAETQGLRAGQAGGDGGSRRSGGTRTAWEASVLGIVARPGP